MYSGTEVFSLHKTALLRSQKPQARRQAYSYPQDHVDLASDQDPLFLLLIFQVHSAQAPCTQGPLWLGLASTSPPVSPHFPASPGWPPFPEFFLCFPISLTWLMLFHLPIISFTSFSACRNPTYLLRSSAMPTLLESLPRWHDA